MPNGGIQWGMKKAKKMMKMCIRDSPLVMPSDEAAVRGLIKTCGAGPRPVRLAYIQDTLSLNTFWASTALAEELSARPDCRVSPESSVFRFDAEGSLVAPGWGSPAALNPTVSRESRS